MCQAQPLKYQISLLLKRYVQYPVSGLNHNFICLLWTGAWKWREFGIRKVDMMGITFSSSFVRDCSLNTGLLEGFYLQLIFSPLIRRKCIHRGNFLNCSFLLCELEVRLVARCLSSSFLIQTQRSKANMRPSVFTILVMNAVFFWCMVKYWENCPCRD